MFTKRRTYWPGIIAVLLALVIGLYFAFIGRRAEQTPVAQTRTVQLTVSPDYESYFSGFEEKSLTSDETSVAFYGKMPYAEEVSEVFDNVSLEDGLDAENYDVVYDCTFDMDALQYHFIATLLDADGNIVGVDEMVTDAFVTESGGLDAYLEIGGETYLLGDYCSPEAINDCFFGWLFRAIVAVVVVVVVVYVVVAETAEQIKGRANYEYNVNLEKQGMGVSRGNYITAQNEKSRKGYRSAYYKFGFTTFEHVGCEVAAAYNAAIALGKTEMLSETIKKFETLSIEFAVGWGNLGSEPLKIYRYLDKKNMSYGKYTNYALFKSCVARKSNCHIIMSRWNKTGGLHTFYIHKIGSTFYSYNWQYLQDSYPNNNLDTFNNGSGFIIGYIVS